MEISEKYLLCSQVGERKSRFARVLFYDMYEAIFPHYVTKKYRSYRFSRFENSDWLTLPHSKHPFLYKLKMRKSATRFRLIDFVFFKPKPKKISDC